jgi:xanthine/uracil permease
MLHNAAITAVMMVLPTGTDVPNWLQCLLMQIRDVVAHGVCHGAVGALTVAHLYLSHKMDLREMVPKFPMADEIPDDIDIR